MTISAYTSPVTGRPTVSIQRYRNGLRITAHNNVTPHSLRRVTKLVTRNHLRIRLFDNGFMGWSAFADDGLS